jgi:hypothetical protein
MTPKISRFGRRTIVLTLAGCCLVATGCSDDSNPPDDAPADTVPQGEETDLPDTSLDVSDGSGEGGNRSGEGGGTPQP